MYLWNTHCLETQTDSTSTAFIYVRLRRIKTGGISYTYTGVVSFFLLYCHLGAKTKDTHQAKTPVHPVPTAALNLCGSDFEFAPHASLGRKQHAYRNCVFDRRRLFITLDGERKSAAQREVATTYYNNPTTTKKAIIRYVAKTKCSSTVIEIVLLRRIIILRPR